MDTWLHRISHHAEVSNPLLEKGFLTIGFSDFVNPKFLEAINHGGWDSFEEAVIKGWGHPRRTRHNLWRFIAEMKIGDRVLVPSWRGFSLYKIESDAMLISSADVDGLTVWNNKQIMLKPEGIFIDETHLDIGFFRKVSLIAKDIPRYEFADAALTSRMKIRSTNAKISDLSESVDKALRAFIENRPISIHAQFLASSAKIFLDLLQNEINPKKFEKLIAWYFDKQGADETRLPAANSSDKQGDADIVAVFEPLKVIYYIQAKHHKGITADWATQQVQEYRNHQERMDDGYSRIAWVVTTSENFSD